MVAPERQHRGAGRKDSTRVLDNGFEYRIGTMRVEPAVAVVDDRQSVAGTETPGIYWPIEVDRCRADSGGTQSRTGAICRGDVQRNTGNGDVDPREILGVSPSHEREHAGEGVLFAISLGSTTCNGAVALNHDVGHEKLLSQFAGTADLPVGSRTIDRYRALESLALYRGYAN